jgi:hypothetical protein
MTTGMLEHSGLGAEYPVLRLVIICGEPGPALAPTAGYGLRTWSIRHRELTVDRALPCGPDGERLGRDRR